MQLIFTLLSEMRYIDPPSGWMAWVGLAALLSIDLVLLWMTRGYNKRPFKLPQWLLLFALLALTPLTSLLFGIRLQGVAGLPSPGIPREAIPPIVMPLAALPWVIAGGLLGPLPAAVIGLFQGVFAASYLTHIPFTPLVTALLAILFSAAVRQRYRTRFFRLIRHPLAAAAGLALLIPLLQLVIIPIASQGRLASRLDYALTNLAGSALASALEVLIAGLIAEIIVLAAPGRWYSPGPLEPSPAERSLSMRFVVSLAPLALALMLTLIFGDWIVASKVARGLLQTQMAGAGATAAGGVPYFHETGQNLIQSAAADSRLQYASASRLGTLLAEQLQAMPFFNQLAVINEQGEVVAGYPTRHSVGNAAPIEVQMGVQAVFNGMPFQSYSSPPVEEGGPAQVAFITVIGSAEDPQRVLIGHADLNSNPLIQPSVAALNSLAAIDGAGILIDENNRILYHPDPLQIWETFPSELPTDEAYFDDTAPDGTRQILYYLPTEGRDWSVVMDVPAIQVQQIALTIAAPLLLIIVALAMVSLVVLRVSLGMITRSLENLADEAGRLAEGRLDRQIVSEEVDEVGRLSRAFEQMRLGLKARMDDLNRLLVVSQGVASSLEVSEAVQPVLESALGAGNAARVALAPDMVPGLNGDTSGPLGFGSGPAAAQYQYLDEQILTLTRQQDRLVLSNLYRPRLLNFIPGSARPESLMAVALKHENQYYGALWVTYDQPHTFSEEEVRFLATLGGQAALAAANARLFMSAEIGRKRLESILASTPDPVLVTDQDDCLLLANPAAWQVLGLGMDASEGLPIERVVTDHGLLELLRSNNPEKGSTEIPLTGGRVFLASATSVLAEGRRVGRVCVMRDITHFKELDTLKTEFVSTVSHDLRSPLTLMRGYATMLEMVGHLNEQQVGYVRKIVAGVESMSRLVNSLLDLGRIEAGVGLQLESVPVVDVVERVVASMQVEAAQKQIELVSEVPQQSNPLIEADPALLQQAVQNLVENAIKYNRRGGKVMVRVQVQPPTLVIQVIDNGLGIAPMDLPRMFEKFYRGAQAGSKELRGAGLGLAIVRSIAERHGGRVWAESRLGKGSTFYLSLPLRQSKRLVEESPERASDSR